jgi:hypothetical protein
MGKNNKNMGKIWGDWRKYGRVSGNNIWEKWGKLEKCRNSVVQVAM